MNKVLLINEKTIKDFSIVSDNLDGKTLLPAIRVAQDISLESAIGPVLTKKICDLVETGEINSNADYKLLLDNYITPFLVFETVSKVILSSSFKIANAGLYQPMDEHKQNQDYRNNQLLGQQYSNYANDYCIKMKDFLLKNVNKYPEYRKVENYERESGTRISGLFLDDVPDTPRTYYRRWFGYAYIP